MENEVIKALKTRRSIRSYKPEQITDEELRTVLEAGTWAPTAKGLQDPWIVAVQNPALLKRISRMNAAVWGKDEDIDPFYGAPTFVLVFGSADWVNAVPDGSLVRGNMMNAAFSLIRKKTSSIAVTSISSRTAVTAAPAKDLLPKKIGLQITFTASCAP